MRRRTTGNRIITKEFFMAKEFRKIWARVLKIRSATMVFRKEAATYAIYITDEQPHEDR